MRRPALLAALGLWLAAAAAADPGPLPTFESVYEIRIAGLTVGEVHRRLQRDDDDTLVFESRTEPRGIATLIYDDHILERSHWRYGEAGRVVPLRYTYDRTGGRKERRARLQFDWEKGRVRNVVQDEPWTMDIPPGTQDKLGYQLAIMQDLRHGRPAAQYPIADGGKLKRYLVDNLGEETIETPLGRLRTVKLQRAKDSYPRITTLWCAVELDYLPVRITHKEKDGTVFRMDIASLEGMRPPPQP